MPPTKRAKTPYRMVTQPTWELVRAAYLGGMTAQAVADRFGLGVHNVRRKIHDEGWSKRAYAEARQATVQAGDPPAPRPKGRRRGGATSHPPDPGPDAPPPAVLNRVLERAREALVAGKGSDASALIKAAREYVILSQDIQDARAATKLGAGIWARHNPQSAEAMAEVLAMQSLHDRWTKPDDAELRRRFDADMKWLGEEGIVGDDPDEAAPGSRLRRRGG